MPKMRLDYIFANDKFMQSRIFSAGIDVTEDTLNMSDHFPVYLSWKEVKSQH